METVRFARRQMLCRPGDKVVAMYNVERRCAVVRVIEVTEDLLEPRRARRWTTTSSTSPSTACPRSESTAGATPAREKDETRPERRDAFIVERMNPCRVLYRRAYRGPRACQPRGLDRFQHIHFTVFERETVGRRFRDERPPRFKKPREETLHAHPLERAGRPRAVARTPD